MYEDLEQFIACPSCGQANSTRYDLCPNCGRVLHAASIRIRGAVSVVLGILLSGGIGYLIVLIAQIISRSGDPRATTRFNGGPAAAAGIFALLGFILVFGLICIVMGGWMVRYGWRNPKLFRIVWIFGLIFWLAGLVVSLIKLL